MPADVITEHRVTHPEIDVDGDEATGIWYLQDKVIVAEFDFMLIGAGFYHDRYRRTADGWKISVTGYDRTYDASLSTKALDFKVKAGRAVNILSLLGHGDQRARAAATCMISTIVASSIATHPPSLRRRWCEGRTRRRCRGRVPC